MKSPVKRANHVTVERLILHVGPHKTGTTAIQTALHRNRDSLIRAGVFVPVNAVVHGQHIPVLRQFYRGKDFEKKYPWHSEELDISEILAEMGERGCGTLVLSSEHFSRGEASAPVSQLLKKLSPRQLIIVAGMRPAMENVVSSFSEVLKVYEILGRKPPESMMTHFENRLGPAWSGAALSASIDSWRSIVADSSFELMAFRSGIDVLDLFEQGTGLTLPDRENLTLNERLSVCGSRVNWDLQHFIHRSFSSASEQKDVIVTAVDGFLNTPVPEHECDCAEAVAVSDVAAVEKAFSVYRERLLASATRVWGDPVWLAGDSSRTYSVPRRPDSSTHDLVVKMLLISLSKTGNIFRDMAEGNEFWQETARKNHEAADYWRRQYEELTGT